MHVEMETLPALRLATLRHLGPYQEIGRTFGRLDDILTRAGLPHRELVGVYYDDPAVTPEDQLRSDAGVLIDEGVPLPAGLRVRNHEIRDRRQSRQRFNYPFRQRGVAREIHLGAADVPGEP